MNQDSNDFIILFIFAFIFIVTHWFVSHFFITRKKKIYDQALKDHSIIEAKSVKIYMLRHDRNENGMRQDPLYESVYEYTIQGKNYKKKIVHGENNGKATITLYYDKQHPKRAVTATEATQSNKITPITIAFFTMLIVGNILIRMLGLL